MEHIVKIKDRRVVDIQATTGDLDGHRVVQNSSNVDTIRFIFDKEWPGYPSYSVIFSRDEAEYADAEYALDYSNPVLVLPAAMLDKSGKLRFSVKALDANNVQRLITESTNALLHVVSSGPVDGGAGNEAQLTRLEKALDDTAVAAETLADADQAIEDINDAIERAEAIADLDYNEAIHKPSINEVTLQGDKDLDDLGMSTATNLDILALFADWS